MVDIDIYNYNFVTLVLRYESNFVFALSVNLAGGLLGSRTSIGTDVEDIIARK